MRGWPLDLLTFGYLAKTRRSGYGELREVMNVQDNHATWQTLHKLNQVLIYEKTELIYFFHLNSLGISVTRCVSNLLGVLDILSDLVETDLLGDSFSSSSVFGTGLILEDGIDIF